GSGSRSGPPRLISLSSSTLWKDRRGSPPSHRAGPLSSCAESTPDPVRRSRSSSHGASPLRVARLPALLTGAAAGFLPFEGNHTMLRKAPKIPRKTREEVIAETVRRELEKQQEEKRKARQELFRRAL